jgi:ketosteroid isomerase-like protein
MEGTHGHDLPGMPAMGRSFKDPCASVGELRNGEITGDRDYWNSDALLEQLGLR